MHISLLEVKWTFRLFANLKSKISMIIHVGHCVMHERHTLKMGFKHMQNWICMTLSFRIWYKNIYEWKSFLAYLILLFSLNFFFSSLFFLMPTFEIFYPVLMSCSKLHVLQQVLFSFSAYFKISLPCFELPLAVISLACSQ